VERSTLRPPQMLDKNATIRQLFLPSYRSGIRRHLIRFLAKSSPAQVR
jgi:hypothetical protein